MFQLHLLTGRMKLFKHHSEFNIFSFTFVSTGPRNSWWLVFYRVHLIFTWAINSLTHELKRIRFLIPTASQLQDHGQPACNQKHSSIGCVLPDILGSSQRIEVTCATKNNCTRDYQRPSLEGKKFIFVEDRFLWWELHACFVIFHKNINYRLFHRPL